MLTARIDRLAEEPKRLLQAASVLGREFSPRVLRAIWDSPSAPEPALEELKRFEFLFERVGAGEPLYVFKHALTQDVAYETLLTPRRQALHAAAARTLEALYADRLEEAYDRLAYHSARAADAPRAVKYLGLVAERAARGYAHAEAVTALQQALEQAERLPGEDRDRQMVALATRCAESLFYLGRRQEAVEFLSSHEDWVDQTRDPALSAPYFYWLAHNHSFLGNREKAADAARRALEEGERAGDERYMGRACFLLGLEDTFAGRTAQCLAHQGRAAELLERTTDRRSLGSAYWQLGYQYVGTGEYARALEIAEKVQVIGKTAGDRRLESNAAEVKAVALVARGEYDAAIELSQQALELAPDAFERALHRGYLGWAYLEKADFSLATATLEQAVREATEYRSTQVQSWFKAFLAAAYLEGDRIDQARDLAQQAFALAEDARHPLGIGWAQQVLGQVEQRRGSFAEAERHLQRALKVFLAIELPFLTARTCLYLAALLHAQGDRDRAIDYLAEAHKQFTALDLPKWAERTAQLAAELCIGLSPLPAGEGSHPE